MSETTVFQILTIEDEVKILKAETERLRKVLNEIYYIGYNQSSGYTDAKAIKYAQKLAKDALEVK